MVITRHNYEEFFLLLADGELSPAQEETVLSFVQQHPDLADELDSLMQCRLDAEIPPIFPKEKLLKPVIWDVETPDEIQVQLLALLDNELSVSEKAKLEQQIAADKSLQLEWDILKANARLEAEPAPSFPKEKLLKPTIWNIEEPDTVYVQMMALLDNELPETDKTILEEKIAADKGLQVEWQSLRQAKLPAIAVVFPNKEVLYREKEQRRIGGWMRWAAAAAVIIGLGWTFWPQSARVTGTGEVAITTPGDGPTKTTIPQKVEQTLPGNPGETDQQQDPSVPGKTEATKEQAKNLAVVTTQKSNLNNGLDNGTKQSRIVSKSNGVKEDGVDNGDNKTMAINTDRGDENDQAASFKTRNVITGSTGDPHETEPMQPKQLNTLTANMQHNKNETFRTASYEDIAAAENADDDVVYIAGARLNKQKVRGVFRGITRSLGRTFSKSKVEADNEATPVSRALIP